MKAMGLSLLLGATALAAPPAPVTQTVHLDLPSGGALKMAHSSGELVVEAWDQPGVEIASTKSVKPGSQGRLFDRVKITAERKGNDVVVTTTLPKHSRLLRLFEGETDYDIDYTIRVPRDTRIEIQHDMGEVHIQGVTGEIRVTDKMGLITAQVPQDGSYSIDAKSRLGSVVSDFEGSEKREHLFGNSFAATPASARQKLFLRMGYGDILVLKLNHPQLHSGGASQ